VSVPDPSGATAAAGGGSAVRAARLTAAPPWRPRLFRTLQPPVRGTLNRVLPITVVGEDNVPMSGPVILAGNHSGWLDGPLVVIEAPRPVRCLVKSELYRGVLGWALTTVGQIPVNRGKPDRTALHACLSELASGGCVGVFPEGTRGSGELEEVQHGIAYLAVHSGAPVVPVACLGTAQAFPRGAKKVRRDIPITVSYGKPFTIERPANPRSRRALADVAESIRIRLAAHLAESRTL
jgi:1-acyl-sn-glycerol-3-phosphate acyltransferase